MVKCLCIDDSGKPEVVPNSKWIKKGAIYTVIYTVVVLPQEEVAFQLREIDLDESCYPYEYFLSSRFAFYNDDFDRLLELMNESAELEFELKKLIETTIKVGA